LKQLGHEKLHVYQAAIKFLALATRLQENIPRGHSILIELLRRAALSTPLNIAEGSGKSSKPDCARFFTIARDSALEWGAILDACFVLGLATQQEIQQGKDLLVAVVSMLAKLRLNAGAQAHAHA
jgi:four helix bundle protein